MRATIEGYTFDFPNATSISKFDGPTHRMSQAMKAVDVIIELPDLRLYVEVKDLEAFKENLKDKSKAEKKEALTKLRCDLAYKYRDSLLYHWCQEMPEKNLVSIPYQLECFATQSFQGYACSKISLYTGGGKGDWSSLVKKLCRFILRYECDSMEQESAK